MTYYTAVTGSWKDGSVRLIAESYSRKYIFNKAQNRANQSGRMVTVRIERGNRVEFTEVHPEQI